MKLHLIRHGQSTHNANDDIPHNPDPPLTRLGREQAEITASALHAADLGAVALYASPMRRALETAAPLQAALKLPAHILPDLCEAGGLREHCGLCREDILREWPEVLLDERITADGWWTAGTREDAEEVMYARAAQALLGLRARHRAESDTLLIVTHGRFGSALISAALGLGPVGYTRFPFHNCAVSRIDFHPHARVAAYPPPASLLAASQGEPQAVQLLFHDKTEHLPLSLLT